MAQKKNLYDYRTPKSGNEETGFFNVKGRINRTAFFLRLLLTAGIYGIGFIIYTTGFYTEFGFRIEVFFETIHLYLLPFLLSAFILIQGVKRMHDINLSGWYILIPVYKLYLISCPGSKGNNNYGIDPTPIKNIEYFDQLDKLKKETKQATARKVDKVHQGNAKSYSGIIAFSIIALGLFLFIRYNTLSNQSELRSASLPIDSLDIIDTSTAETDDLNALEERTRFNYVESWLIGNRRFGTDYIQPYGTVEIEKNGSLLSIYGDQSNNDDYCRIEGDLEIIDDRTLKFTGKISLRYNIPPSTDETKEPVIEDKTISGEFTFKRNGDRSYWRLEQPETGYFEHNYYYIDIFMPSYK